MRRLNILLVAICVFSAIALAFCGHRFFSSRTHAREQAAGYALSETSGSARRIDETFLHIQKATTAIADDITAGRVARDAIPERLRAVAETDARFLGVVAAFQPHAYDPAKRLHAPYCVRRQGVLNMVQVEDTYDYTQPGHDWYTATLTNGPMWQEPFFGQASDSLLAMYCAPFYGPDASGERTLLGVVGITVSLDDVNSVVNELDIGRMGYGEVVSAGGLIISHPVSEFVRVRKPLSELADETGTPQLKEALARALRGESGAMAGVRTEAGRDAILAFSPLKVTGWTLLTHSLQEESDVETVTRRRLAVNLLFAAMAFCISLAGIMAMARGCDVRRCWHLSNAVSFLFIVATGCFWYVAMTSNSYLHIPGERLANKAFLRRYLETTANAAIARHEKAPTPLPTGIYLHSIEMPDSRNVVVKGVLWQTYRSDAPAAGEPGIRLPDATDVTITEAYRQKADDRETVGWDFVATIPQHFQYRRYPLNRECITIRLAAAGFLDSAILVPDLDSYKYTTPSALPGLDSAVTLPGWTLEKSFFEYRRKTSTSTLGLVHAAEAEAIPELRYDIVIKNNFVNSFMSSVTPILVVFGLLFAMVMLTGRNGEGAPLMEFGMASTITNSSCLFFIIILSHIDMRAHMVSDGVMYIEHFYILQYLVILLICLNAFLFIRRPELRILQFQDNLLVKLLFCPVCLGLMFLSTAITFY